MAGLVGLVCWQVFTRFVLRDPSSFTEEAARFALIWLGLLGAARALGGGLHLSIDLLALRSPGWARVTSVASRAVCATFAGGVMTFGGAKLVALTLDLGQVSPALGWQLGHVYVALPLAGALMVLYAALGPPRQGARD
ncbi:MAG: TRAP transporter small permease [Acidobacteriota bacterium]|nr:TRAP transporter small permease [Acidobacteriota bacterium]